jgi:uncharacterized protein
MKLNVRVTTNTKKNEIAEDIADLFGVRKLKIKVNQPPEDGKANKAVIEVLAEYFNVRKSAIKITSGLTSRDKVIEINEN